MVAGFLASCTFAVHLSRPPCAAAAEPNEQRLAREEFKRGLDAARALRWPEAREAFARAYSLDPKTSTLFNLAGAQARTGRLVDAAESYRTITRASSGATDEERTHAREALSQLEPRIARLRIEIKGGTRAGDSVLVDGHGVATAVVGSDLPVDPGDHEITLSRESAVTRPVRVHVGEGETAPVSLVPVIVEPSYQPPPGERRDTISSPSSTSSSIFASPWFWVAAVVLTAGATVGVVCLAGACSSEEKRTPHEGSLTTIVFP